MQLNPEQLKAVHYLTSPLLVIAGAGSGKTRVITQKVCHLIENEGILPKHICAVTFTNKAALEMKSRLVQLLPKEKRKGLQVSTFHILGLKILKKHADLAGLIKPFSIYDTDDCTSILKQLLPAQQGADKAFMYTVMTTISQFKNELILPESVMQHEFGPIYQAYQHLLRAYNAVDFDDLILLPVLLCQQHEAILRKWQDTIRYLLVDEYQDVNTSQYALVKWLTATSGNLTVVGDDAQSIYAWRGAKPEYLSQLSQDFPSLKTIVLSQNYRSTGNILSLANHLIQKNAPQFEKALWSHYGEGETPRVVVCRDEEDEAQQIIGDMITRHLQENIPYGQFAILYRSNYQSRIFEKALQQQGIMYTLSGGESFFSKSEVKDVMAYLKLMANGKDDGAFLRAIQVPRRGIGAVTLSTLSDYAKKVGGSLFDVCDHFGLSTLLEDKTRGLLARFKERLVLLSHVIDDDFRLDTLKQLIDNEQLETFYYENADSPKQAEKKMANIWDLMGWIVKLHEKSPQLSFAEVINKLILIDMLSQQDKALESDAVTLMTLHAAKGLEFPYVYLVGMEEDILPHKNSIEADSIEEERRLCYVGITRAEKGLCFSMARLRRRAGEIVETTMSRFLTELPKDALIWIGTETLPKEALDKVAEKHLLGLKALLQ
jgi:ATP-dependent DNA helicase Rep